MKIVENEESQENACFTRTLFLWDTIQDNFHYCTLLNLMLLVNLPKNNTTMLVH